MEQMRKESWWSRSWKWVIPTGCLGLLVLAATFFVAIVALVMGMIKSSPPYRAAVARASADPRVTQRLGQPLTMKWWVMGSIRTSGPTGHASLTIPVSGPRGSGKIFVEAVKRAGRWELTNLITEIDSTGERINLLEPTLGWRVIRSPGSS